MHHKRKRAKNQRAGCLLCKAHKANGAKRHRHELNSRSLKQIARAEDELNTYNVPVAE